MSRLAYLIPLTLLLAVAPACGGDDDDGPVADAAPNPDTPTPPDAAGPDATSVVLPEAPPSTPPTGDPKVTLVTYNTGLIDANIVKAPLERKPLIIAALKQLDADVICLQEVFNQYGGPGEMAAQLADTYPHSFWTFAGQGHPLGNGVLIVSKHPLYRGRELAFQAQSGIVDRVIIAANVLTADSYFTVMCTHLQAGLDTGGPGASVSIRQAEINEVFAWAQAEGYLAAGNKTFWLGDFNAGPDPVGQCAGMMPPSPDCCDPMAAMNACTAVADVDSYNLVKTMFTDANDNTLGCTSCRSRFIPLQVLNTFNYEPSQRIDHCLYRNIGASVPIEKGLVMTQDPAIQYSGPGAPQGGEVLHSLSDHDGVRCKFGSM
jgi:endonuclease/exonuclease/phosphatase family metal-dependent hydrolase